MSPRRTLTKWSKEYCCNDLEAKGIFLGLTNYPIVPGKTNYKCEHQLLDAVTHEEGQGKMAFTFVDLVNFDTQNKIPCYQLSREEKGYYFLRHAQTIQPHALDAVTAGEPIIQKAFKTLDRLYWTEAEIQMYAQAEKRA